MSVDYATKTYAFSIDGTQVNTSPIAFYSDSSANFSEIRIYHGGGQMGMIVNDLTVFPEPTGITLLLPGAGAILLRRRLP